MYISQLADYTVITMCVLYLVYLKALVKLLVIQDSSQSKKKLVLFSDTWFGLSYVVSLERVEYFQKDYSR